MPCNAVADPLAVGCKPVRVVVAVDETDAEDAHARALPAAELPALAQRYAAKVSSMSHLTLCHLMSPSVVLHAISDDSSCASSWHVERL